MAYLTETELTTYCSLPGITLQDAINASQLIDSIKGKSFLEKTYTEQVKLTRKRQGCFMVHRGKLLHYPRISIVSVTGKTPGYFGATTESYDTTSLTFDADDEPYFEFYDSTAGVHSIFPRVPPAVITVKYTAGYSTIPESLKVICGLLCDNIKANGGYRSYKSRTDYDMTISFGSGDDAVMSSSIVKMIDAITLV